MIYQLMTLVLALFTAPLSAYLFQANMDFPESAEHAPVNCHIRTATPEDKKMWDNIKKDGLLFEKEDLSIWKIALNLAKQRDPYERSCQKVFNNLTNNHGAKAITVDTIDGEQIAGLVRKAPKARVTLVYATGFFTNQTPSREWVAPFYRIFHDCNILSFDWRSSGKSSGTFSYDAIYDLRAMLQHCHDDPVLGKTKIVLVGFCLGGAISLEALREIKYHKPELMPDAFVLGGTPSVLADMHKSDRLLGLAPNSVVYALGKFSFIRKRLINYFIDPALQQMTPLHQLGELHIPVCFEYCTTKDTFARLDDCHNNYHAAVNAPVRHVIVSDLAGHVRLHKETPVQYRAAYEQFFARAGLLHQADPA